VNATIIALIIWAACALVAVSIIVAVSAKEIRETVKERKRRCKEMVKRLLLMLLVILQTSCAFAPHYADTALTVYAVESGIGVEINPLGYPGSLIAKPVLELAGYGLKVNGYPEYCHGLITGARLGGCIGVVGSIGGLAAGPPGAVVGAILGGLMCWSWVSETAHKSCYSDDWL